MLNWWASAKTFHRWTVLLVRFIREGANIEYHQRAVSKALLGPEGDVKIVGKVMLVNDVVKVNMDGKTHVVDSFDTEAGRLLALKTYFGINLTEDEAKCIQGWDMSLS